MEFASLRGPLRSQRSCFPPRAHSQQNREITLISTPLSWSKEASHFSSTRPSGISHCAFSCREQGHWNAAGDMSVCVESCLCSLCLGVGLGLSEGGRKRGKGPNSQCLSLLQLGAKHRQSLVAILNSAEERLANFISIVKEQSPTANWTCGDYLKYMTK